MMFNSFKIMPTYDMSGKLILRYDLWAWFAGIYLCTYYAKCGCFANDQYKVTWYCQDGAYHNSTPLEQDKSELTPDITMLLNRSSSFFILSNTIQLHSYSSGISSGGWVLSLSPTVLLWLKEIFHSKIKCSISDTFYKIV